MVKLSVEKTVLYLPSPGLGDRRATKHVYSHSEVRTIRSGSGRITGLAHLYRCSETGELRIYGFDNDKAVN